MCSKKVTEAFVNAPWGKLAMISWGDPKNPPILLLHGYMDTAATFTFLVEKLPDKYYFVGVDVPGHGKSDPFPPGLLITKLHVVEVMRLVVEHLEWKTFTFLSHSLSCTMGILYNAFYAGRIEKMIFLDPNPALAWYHVINHHTALWYKGIYSNYYENYQKLNFSKPKSQSLTSWIEAVARTRNLTKEQSEVVLSRSLIPTKNGGYRLSWEQRVKHIAHVEIPTETLYTIMNKLPPTLVINASDYVYFVKIEGAKTHAENLLKNCEESLPHYHTVHVKENLLKNCEESLPHYHTVHVKGGHDSHITNPDLMVGYIESFLTNNGICLKKSKL